MDMPAVMLTATIFGLMCTSGILGYCLEPSNLDEIKQQLKDEIRDYFMESMSYFNIKNILNEVPKKLNISSPEVDGQVLLSKIYGDSRCRKRHLFGSGLNETNERSSCPWHYVLEVDLNREPQTIAKARCSCRRCLEMSNSGYKSSKTSSCKEISYHMPVIRRKCVEPFYKYGIYLEDVAVGCTCQRCTKMDKN